MAAPHAKGLIEQARNGTKLTAKDRRHALGYMMVMEPQTTVPELSDLFQVSERMIRIDKVKLRKSRADEEKEADVGLVIADIAISLESQIAKLEKIGAASKNEKNKIRCAELIFKMRIDAMHALQDVGFIQKNLGNMTVDKFEYRATVALDGSVETRRVTQFDDIVDADFTDVPKALIAAPDEEDVSFTDADADEGAFEFSNTL